MSSKARAAGDKDTGNAETSTSDKSMSDEGVGNLFNGGADATSAWKRPPKPKPAATGTATTGATVPGSAAAGADTAPDTAPPAQPAQPAQPPAATVSPVPVSPPASTVSTPAASVPVDEREDKDDAPSASTTRHAKGFYVSPGVATRLDRYRRKHDLTLTETVFQALTWADERLPEIVHQARRPPKVESGLFPTRQDSAPLRGTGPVQKQYRVTRAEEQVIRGLRRKAGLPDDTKLLAIVLNAFLPGAKD